MDGKYKPATINRYKAAVSSVFKYAQAEDFVSTNPARDIVSRSENNKIVRYLFDDERNRLLDACKQSSCDRMYLLVLMAVTTGARKSEIEKLNWQGIDFKNCSFCTDTFSLRIC